MLGDNTSGLGTVTGNMEFVNRVKQQDAAQSQQDSDTANEPNRAGAKEEAVQTAARQANQVTVTPQMAEGLSKMTGQDWNRLVGVKFDGAHFTAMTTGLSQAKYHQDLLNDRDKLEAMREQSRLEQIGFKGKIDEDMKKNLSDYREKEDERFMKFLKEHGITKSGGTPASDLPPKPKDDPQSLGKQLLDEISKGAKSGDDVVKQAAIENYNSYAKEHKLAPYTEEPGFLDKAISAIKNLGSGGGAGKDDAKRQKATKILQDAKKPVTEGNIKHVMDQLGEGE